MSAAFSGHLALRAERNAQGKTILASQSFRAPFHISKPYWDAEAETLLVQVVNPTAGILAGDKLVSRIEVGAGAALVVTTPAASRIFRMENGSAESRQTFSVESGGWLEMRPEPLVPHRKSRFRQVTEIDVADRGELFFADVLMPGRVGHGEAWLWDELALDLTVRCRGSLVLRERFIPGAAELKSLALLHGVGEEACFANAVLIAEELADDGAWLAGIRALHREGLWVGITRLREAGWALKLVARDNLEMRDVLNEVRQILSTRFSRLRTSVRKVA